MHIHKDIISTVLNSRRGKGLGGGIPTLTSTLHTHVHVCVLRNHVEKNDCLCTTAAFVIRIPHGSFGGLVEGKGVNVKLASVQGVNHSMAHHS